MDRFINILHGFFVLLIDDDFDFILRDLCPNLVKEEFADSQEAEEEKEEDSAMLNADNPAKVDLHIEAEPIPEVYEQAEWIEQMKTLHWVER